MLCLKCSTKPGWIKEALKDLDSLLIDHAHCEKKAAATGLSLLSSYPERVEISLTMSILVKEEIGHYKAVIKILTQRGINLSRDKGDQYAKDLLANAKHNEPARLLDRLITAAIIEARSCERLQIIAKNIEDEKLKDFYTKLSASEAGHYVTYINLAKKYFNEVEVKTRANELSEFEKEIVLNLPNVALVHG
jgi:tRNA 2-(methylsulfanyl)-N6-isopentenyladenosine37 hydroxylase